jgi:hypothetical protein
MAVARGDYTGAREVLVSAGKEEALAAVEELLFSDEAKAMAMQAVDACFAGAEKLADGTANAAVDVEALTSEARKYVVDIIRAVMLPSDGVPAACVDLAVALLERDAKTAKSQIIALVVQEVLVGKLGMHVDLEPVATNVMMRDAAGAMLECAVLVEGKISGWVETECESAGLPGPVADAIIAAIRMDLEGAKGAVSELVMAQLLEKGAPEEVCEMIMILIQDRRDMCEKICNMHWPCLRSQPPSGSAPCPPPPATASAAAAPAQV